MADDLIVRMKGDNKDLKKSLDGAGSRFGKFSQTLKQHSMKIGMAMTAMGGVITAAIGKAIGSFMAFGDQVQKTALKLGTSTEFISEMAFVAEQSGTSIEAVSKAMIAMQRRIEKGGEGLATYTKALARLGLSYEELKDMSPEKQFEAIMDALADTTNHQNRLTAATELFGVSVGAELIPMLEGGSEGMAALRAEAILLGKSLSQEQADAAARFTDALNSLKTALKGVAYMIAETIIPVIEPLINKFKDLTVKTIELMDEMPGLRVAVVGLTAGFGALMLALGPVIIALPTLIKLVNLLKVNMMKLKAASLNPYVLAIMAIVAALVLAYNGSEEFKEAVGELMTAFDNLSESLAPLIKDLGISLAPLMSELGIVLGQVLTPIVKGLAMVFEGWALIIKEMVIPFIDSMIDRVKDLIGWLDKIPGVKLVTDLFRDSGSESSGVGLSDYAKDVIADKGIESYDIGGMVPGAIGQPQLAVVHGGEEVLTPSQQSRNLEATITGNNFYIRNDQDIVKVAEELKRLYDRSAKVGA